MDDNDQGSGDQRAAEGERDDRTQAFDVRSIDVDDESSEDLVSSWRRIGAARGPRSPAEGVRIIGADEAASAIETGRATPRTPDSAPKFGDVPEPPSGPRPSIRFPGSDPAALARPPVAPPPPLRNLWDSPTPDAAPGSAGDAGPPARSAPEPTEPPVRSRAGRFEEMVTRRSPGPVEEVPIETLPPRSPAWDLFDDPALDPSGIDDEDRDIFERFDDIEPEIPESDPFDMAPLARDEPSGAVVLPHWTEPPSGEVPRLVSDSVFSDDPSEPAGSWSGPRWRDQPGDWDDSDFHESLAEDRGARVGALAEPTALEEDDEPFPFLDDVEVAAPASTRRSVSSGPLRARPDRPGPDRPGEGARHLGTRPAPRNPMSGPPRGGPEMNGSGGKGPDLANRLVTGLVAGGVALACAAIGGRALVVLVVVALVVAGAEFFQALRSAGYHPATLLGLAATASAVGAAYWRGEVAQPLILVLVLLFSFLWYLLGVVKARPAMNVAVTVMAFVYIGFLGSYAALILRLPNGVGMLLGAVLATVAHDVGSYFAGRMGGRTPLAPSISPNKTLEGLVGGTFATLIVCLVVVRAMDPPWDLGRAFWLAVVVAIVSPLGDLCESLIKRDLGVKDMGRILPGHGGVLDRIDALLFVIPATYYLAVVLEFG